MPAIEQAQSRTPTYEGVLSAQRGLEREAAYISKKYEAHCRNRRRTWSRVNPIASSPSIALASARRLAKGTRKNDSGGQAIREWLSRMRRSRVVPERCTPRMKMGGAPFDRDSAGTMTRRVRPGA